MALKTITGYDARWNPGGNWGDITLRWTGGATTLLSSAFSGPDEFRLIWQMLEAERTIYWSTTYNYLTTYNEPPGE